MGGMTWRNVAVRLGWALLLLNVALEVAALVLYALGGGDRVVATALVSLVFGAVGAMITSRQPGNAVGWIFAAAGVLQAVSNLTDPYAMQALVHSPGSLPAGIYAAWLNNWIWVPMIFLVAPYLCLVFPDGRVLSPGWRRAVWLSAAGAAIAVAGSTLASGSIANGHASFARFQNPLGAPGVVGTVFQGLTTAGLSLLLVATVLGVVSLVQRFRRSSVEQRQQIKWFAYGLALTVVLVVIGSVLWEVSPAAQYLPSTAIVIAPVAAGIAVLRYRLYDIDVVINKTLVFGALAAFVTAVYVAIVVGVGSLIGQGSHPNTGLSILATAVVAVAFHPARTRSQQVANRVVYGRRATPYEVLSQLAQRMGDTVASPDIAPRMARVLAEGTGANPTCVWLRIGGQLVCEAVWPAGAGLPPAVPLGDGDDISALPGATLTLPVHHQGELLGALTLAKPAGERLTPTEEKLARDVASQAGLVLRNMRLTEDLLLRLDELQASRQRLVAAQDEERRRLERNLHDGAQQQLVALAVKVRLARAVAGKDPAKADDMLTQVEHDAQQTLQDLRDLARGIYPPLLAESGLATALAGQARRAALPVRVDADGIGRYSPATEAAVYFCTLEALQNVAKYAAASAVDVVLRERDGVLVFEIHDDGAGFDPAGAARGMGLQGMSDRLAALGGELDVASSPGRGTTVTGRIPVASADSPSAA
jgi:signal transduction histidine kinase